jgi:long-chain acyl-CoA synthetase
LVNANIHLQESAMKTINEKYPLYEVEHVYSLQDIIVRSSARFRDKLAVEDLRPTQIPSLTYGRFLESIQAFGSALRDIGVPERTHIAVISENRVQWILAYLALASYNYVTVPIDRNLSEPEILTILHASDAKGAVFSEPFREMFAGFRHSLKDLRYLIDMDAPADKDDIHSMITMMRSQTAVKPMPAINRDSTAVIVFTSGSMGRAKGVVLTHGNVTANLMDMLKMIQILPSDRFLSVLPIHHTYECTCGQLCPLMAGGSVHYARSLKTVSDDMISVRPTVLLGVPLLYEKMYKRIQQGISEQKATSMIVGPIKRVASFFESVGMREFRKKAFRKIHERFGGAIRIFIVGGAAPDVEVVRGFRSFGFQFIQGYGLTETSPIVALNRLRNFKDDAAGLVLPSLQARIFEPDAEGRGELLVRGPSVMAGYYHNEAANEQVFDDGWFHTGDFGHIASDGFLHICGRKKNVIISRTGKNVFPEELEDMINKLPFVLESIVYGRKNDKGDEEIAVKIVPNAEEFIQHATRHKLELTSALIEEALNNEIRGLNKRLPVYKQIRRVEVRDQEFAKTTTQKIKRYLATEE